MRVLITGGCGFVGRHFTKRFLDDGASVTFVDDLSASRAVSFWPSFLCPLVAQQKQLTQHYEDVRNWFRRSTSVASDYDLIIHCAAVVGGRLTIDGDPLKVATDLSIDAGFFNWVVRGKPSKVIYFSSSAVYPVELQTQRMHVQLGEGIVRIGNRIAMPDQTYGWAKLSGEVLAGHARESYGLDVAVYRPFSGYGEDQDSSYPMPAICARAVRRENPMTIWGSGEQQRDFIHIDDVVDAVLATYELLPSRMPLNLGTGHPTSFNELARIALEMVGHEAPIVNDPGKPEGVFSRVADPYAMLRLYQPKITLGEGVARVCDYLSRSN